MTPKTAAKPTITRQMCAALQKDIDAALAPVLAKHGLKMKVNRGRFDDYSVRVSLELELAGAEMERAAAQHNAYLKERFGIQVGDKLSRRDGSKAYTVTGATNYSKKYDLTGTTADGKSWRFSHKGLLRDDGSPVVDAWALPPVDKAREPLPEAPAGTTPAPR